MATFRISPFGDGKYIFTLREDDRPIMASAELHASVKDAEDVLATVRACSNAPVEDHTVPEFETVDNPKYEIHYGWQDGFGFVLRSEDGTVIATSEEFPSKAACLETISVVSAIAPRADVVVDGPFPDLLSDELDPGYGEFVAWLRSMIGKYPVACFRDADRALEMLEAEGMDDCEEAEELLDILDSEVFACAGLQEIDPDTVSSDLAAEVRVDEGFAREVMMIVKGLWACGIRDEASLKGFTGTADVITSEGRFEGEIFMGRFDGYGVLGRPDGTVLDGEFSKGRFVEGRITFPDGSVYLGPAMDGVPDGVGRMLDAEGGLYRCEYRDGELVSKQPMVDYKVRRG